MPSPVLEVALPTPLNRYFDYLPPSDCPTDQLQPGIRLSVPFGRRSMTGILIRVKANSELAPEQLKAARAILDEQPVVTAEVLQLTQWASRYYRFAPGDAVFHALPPSMRKGKPQSLPGEACWRLTSQALGVAEQAFSRAPQQLRIWQFLLEHSSISNDQFRSLGLSRAALKAMQMKHLVESVTTDAISTEIAPAPDERRPPLQLNPEQQAAFSAISSGLTGFNAYLLEGVTGSGKTEVYLQAIRQTLKQNRQALVLVPEIGLTPQTIARFRQRFGERVVAIHSQLNDSERLVAWRAAKQGEADIVIGTRSAVFTPFRSLGLIIIDEEHDTSYKQQSGFRYSARDVAVKRAQLNNIPVVLGSATPSIETLRNALDRRYQLLTLHQRAGGARPPSYTLLDIRTQTLHEGFCDQTLEALEQTIRRGEQALIYINRRGFAPTLLCHACGWVAECPHCDSRLVMHRQQRRLQCHHCDYREAVPHQCPQCRQQHLQALGLGTERSEAFLKERFPTTSVLRIDRDTTRNKGSFDALLDRIHSGDPALLIGTQMLAKGHHFPNVTLVAIIDADAGLYSADFRGPERTAQILTQVAGRAGRAEKPGEVLIQTHTPEHPVLDLLARDRYRELCEQLLRERQDLGLPPFGHLAVIHTSGKTPDSLASLLLRLRSQLHPDEGLALIGPVEPPIAKLAGRFRCQLLLKHGSRNALQRAAGQACDWLERDPQARRLRWSIDIDPQDAL